MIWKWKRPAAFLLAAAMIFTMPGVPASAVETDVSTAPGNAPAECSCETHCEQGYFHLDCREECHTHKDKYGNCCRIVKFGCFHKGDIINIMRQCHGGLTRTAGSQVNRLIKQL